MKSINWKVRIKNKSFWIAMVAMALLLIQQVAIIFGYELDFGDLGNQLKDVINTIFAILALLGVVNDPTTKGLSDSNQALTYEVPKED
jgi:phi LC3 family holin